MPKKARRAILFAVAAVASTAVIITGASAAGPGRVTTATGTHPTTARPHTVAASGSLSATARSVDVATLATTPDTGQSTTRAPLGRDGHPTGNLPTRAATSGSVKPVTQNPSVAGGPNVGRTGVTVPHTAPTHTLANFTGVVQAGSNCGGCQPPDVNAAVGATQIVEAVNLRLQVYGKAGGKLCGFSLAALTGATEEISDPRVQYDNVNKRFSASFIPVPASASDTPAIYILATKTSNPCGAWWVFRATATGSLFPSGELLDYPYLGQDRKSLLFSTNDFLGNTYMNSAAFAVPKASVYAGSGFSVSAFAVDFSTAPVTVSGIPMFATTNTFFVASLPGIGYDLWRMNNSAGPGTTMTLQATISAPFNAPSRRVLQPGTTQTLDPLDGRIDWAPVQDGNFVWFAHGMDLGGFPAVRYGAINFVSNTATVATAFHSGTSDDFNPSIGVAHAGTNVVRIWVNWAYTDTPAGVPTTDTVDGVLPGAGVPNLIGTGLNLVRGTSTSSNFRFGDYSSVAIDPAVTTGCVAVTAQEFFGTAGWKTRIARLSLC